MAERLLNEGTPPKIVRVYHAAKANRVLIGSIWLKDVPGALASAAAALAALGVNLVASSTSAVNGTGYAEWGFFAETSERILTREALTEAFQKTPQVLKFEFEVGPDGVVFDDFHYPLRFSSGEQGMIVGRSTFSGMLTHIREVFGSGGSVIAYQLGYSTGEKDAQEMIAALGEEKVVSNLPRSLNLYLAQGWGIPEVVETSIDPLSLTVRFTDNFECVGLRASRPNSHFMRGLLAGLMKALFNKNVECMELKCLATGDDFCLFRCVEI